MYIKYPDEPVSTNSLGLSPYILSFGKHSTTSWCTRTCWCLPARHPQAVQAPVLGARLSRGRRGPVRHQPGASGEPRIVSLLACWLFLHMGLTPQVSSFDFRTKHNALNRGRTHAPALSEQADSARFYTRHAFRLALLDMNAIGDSRTERADGADGGPGDAYGGPFRLSHI